MPSPKPEPNPLRFIGVGVELAGAVGGMALLGYAFDQWKGTEPWGVLVGSMLGVVGGLYNLVKKVTQENR